MYVECSVQKTTLQVNRDKILRKYIHHQDEQRQWELLSLVVRGEGKMSRWWTMSMRQNTRTMAGRGISPGVCDDNGWYMTCHSRQLLLDGLEWRALWSWTSWQVNENWSWVSWIFLSKLESYIAGGNSQHRNDSMPRIGTEIVGKRLESSIGRLMRIKGNITKCGWETNLPLSISSFTIAPRSLFQLKK